MKELNNELITQNYTKIIIKDEKSYNANHLYSVNRVSDNEELCEIHFQQGPIKETGVNGVANEDLIAIVINRLESFQGSAYNCEENAKAINLLQETLMVLRSRTNKRVIRGVEGTSEV